MKKGQENKVNFRFSCAIVETIELLLFAATRLEKWYRRIVNKV